MVKVKSKRVTKKTNYIAGAITYAGKIHPMFDTWSDGREKTYPRYQPMCSCPNTTNGYGANQARMISDNLEYVDCSSGRKWLANWIAFVDARLYGK